MWATKTTIWAIEHKSTTVQNRLHSGRTVIPHDITQGQRTSPLPPTLISFSSFVWMGVFLKIRLSRMFSNLPTVFQYFGNVSVKIVLVKKGFLYFLEQLGQGNICCLELPMWLSTFYFFYFDIVYFRRLIVFIKRLKIIT